MRLNLASRWARGALWLPTLACVLIAILLFGAGTSETSLRCERASGTCTWRRSSVYAASERSFRIADVREVRFVDGLGKHGRDARTTLVFASGGELGLAHGTRDTARARFTTMHSFFAPGA
ncbi:MAG: hypothetical protein H7138_11050, partial [Myxococcales bacterium]|nr:hypothetical protein [Myxococcales bacterium]